MAFPEAGWNPFAFTDIWETSFLDKGDREDGVPMIRPIQLDLLSGLLDNPYALSKPLELELQLPVLDALDGGISENLAPSDSSITSTEDVVEPIAPSDESGFEDVWHFDYDVDAIEILPRLSDWENFYDLTASNHNIKYLSEGGPAVFDAASAAAAKANGSKNLVAQAIQADAMISSLWQLGLGRPSVLFSYDDNVRKLSPAIANGSISGHSLVASQGVFESFLQGGNDILELRDFITKTYSENTCPSKIALANIMSTMLAVIESDIIADPTSNISILTMQQHFRRPHEMVRFLVDTTQSVARAMTNTQVISAISQVVASYDGVDGWKKMLSAAIVNHVASPWLESMSTALVLEGCPRRLGISPDKMWDSADDESLSDAVNLVFLAEEHRASITESLRGIQYLRDYVPNHPLLHSDSQSTETRPLELAFTWKDADRIATQAKEYESQLLDAVKGITTMTSSGVHDSTSAQSHVLQDKQEVFGLEEVNIYANIERARLICDLSPAEVSAHKSADCSITVQTKEALRAPTADNSHLGVDLRPPISSIFNISLQPMLVAQRRLINVSCLRALFFQNELRKHLSLHHATHLLGSGTFVSRLSMSLFDPELVTTERELGVMRSATAMGLRVGSTTRTNWPPASSELRLALMGVLRESWQNERQFNARTTARNSPLPGNMSFGIRELAEDEIEKCLEVDSIYALDFLRLQYETPGPLSNILTKSSLEKYDRAFRFFLKLMRMTFVTNMMWRQTTLQMRQQRRGYDKRHENTAAERFRTEASYLITTLCSHFFANAVETPGRRFQRYLYDLERDLKDFDCSSPAIASIDRLERLHSEMLDGILSGLLLRHHQLAASTLLEEIFNLVLKFSRAHDAAQAKSNEETVQKDAELRSLYETFQTKTRDFISSCQRLGSRADLGARSRTQAKDDGSRSALEIVELLRLGGHFMQAE